MHSKTLSTRLLKDIHGVKKVKISDYKGKERRGDLYRRDGNVVSGEGCFVERLPC